MSSSYSGPGSWVNRVRVSGVLLYLLIVMNCYYFIRISSRFNGLRKWGSFFLIFIGPRVNPLWNWQKKNIFLLVFNNFANFISSCFSYFMIHLKGFFKHSKIDMQTHRSSLKNTPRLPFVYWTNLSVFGNWYPDERLFLAFDLYRHTMRR